MRDLINRFDWIEERLSKQVNGNGNFSSDDVPFEILLTSLDELEFDVLEISEKKNKKEKEYLLKRIEELKDKIGATV